MMNSFKLIVLATALAVAPACKKQEASAPPPATETAGATAGSAMAGSGSAMAGSDTGSAGSAAMAGSDTGSAGSAAMAGSDTGSAAMAGSAAAPAADPDADSIVVLAKHVEVKDTDPVHVRFERFKVVKADFDPKKVEGGKATIEIDTTSLKSGSDKRDGHLQTPDYLDTAKFATVTIDIDKVKKKADKTYAAEATVKFRGVTKKYPVTFDVVDQKDDSIRIKSEVAFSRLDFKVGKDSKDPKIAPVQPELVMQLQLTLKKT